MTAEQMGYEFEVGYDRITNFDAPGYVAKEISTFLTKAQENIIFSTLEASAFTERNKKSMARLRQVIPLSVFTVGNYPNGYISDLKITLSFTDVTFDIASQTITLDAFSNTDSFEGIRVGDQVTVYYTYTPTSLNNKVYNVIKVESKIITVSPQTPVEVDLYTDVEIVIFTVDSVQRVRNERADIDLIENNFYFNKVAGNVIEDVEVEPTDDDFYHANKSNPYKKPSIKKIWRIDSADESSKKHEYITDGTFTLNNVYLHIDRKARPIIVPDTVAQPYSYADDGLIDGIYFLDFADGLNCELDPIVHRDIVEKAVKLAYAASQDQTGFQISSVQEQQE